MKGFANFGLRPNVKKTNLCSNVHLSKTVHNMIKKYSEEKQNQTSSSMSICNWQGPDLNFTLAQEVIKILSDARRLLKCDTSATILIRNEYWYCDTCFITNTNHKFRACLGKSKTLSSNEKVLICLSGSADSMVLLDLVHGGITLNGSKKLRILPFFLHITETDTEDGTKKALYLINQCEKYNFDLYVININEYYSTNTTVLSQPNIIPQKKSDTLHNLKLKTSPTIYHDVMVKIKRQLFLKIAKELSCQIIFTAETTTQLAKRLLCNLAVGRGSQVENDIGFADQRDKSVRILRPMKDITNEEIDYFLKVKQIDPVYDHSNTEKGLQSVINNFVVNLQENYPSTISTVCKTANKIGSNENNADEKCCTLCQSNISLKSAKLTAVEATIFSRLMCFKQADADCKLEDMQNIREDKNPMFPNIYETLCYGCSRNYSELDICKLPHTILSGYKNKDAFSS